MTHSHANGHAHSHGHPHSHEHLDSHGIETDEDIQEDLHRATICASFDRYLQTSMSANQKRRADFYALSANHQALLPGYAELLREVSRMSSSIRRIPITMLLLGRRSSADQ